MRSLRARLSLSLLAGSGLLLLVSALVFDVLVEAWLQDQFDRGLEAKARALVTLTKDLGGEVELDFADEFMPEFEAAENPEYFQVWLADGTVLERSRSLASGALSRHREPAATPRFADVRLVDGRRGRQVQVDFVPQRDTGAAGETTGEVAHDPTRPEHRDGRFATVAVAKGRRELDTTMRSLRLALAGGGALLMAAAAALVRMAIRAGLRPLSAVARQVEGLGAASLASRLDAAGSPAELRPLIGKLNDLLARLDKAFHRERRLSSDVAHELRTPVAELRILAEVGSRWPEDRETTRRFFDDVHQIALRMERVIADLLALARSEGGLEQVREEDVHLRELVDAVGSSVAPEAASRQVELVCEVPPSLRIRTDREKLERVVANLLANAVTYCPAGATVRCTAGREGGRVTLTIANPAPDLCDDDLPRMFERFWRRDPARASQNAGLGMPLVQALSELLDLELTTSLDAAKTFRVSLSARRGDPL